MKGRASRRSRKTQTLTGKAGTPASPIVDANGIDKERTSAFKRQAPRAEELTRYGKPSDKAGHAVLIFFNSRRQSLKTEKIQRAIRYPGAASRSARTHSRAWASMPW